MSYVQRLSSTEGVNLGKREDFTEVTHGLILKNTLNKYKFIIHPIAAKVAQHIHTMNLCRDGC